MPGFGARGLYRHPPQHPQLRAAPVPRGAVGTDYVSVVANDAPIAWWKLDDLGGTAADAVGIETLTFLNSPTVGQPGLNNAGTSVHLTAASDQAAEGGNNMPAGSALGASCAAWASWDSLSTPDFRYTMSRWGTQGSPFHWFYLYWNGSGDNELVWQWHDTALADWRAATIANVFLPTLGQGYHLVASHDYVARTVTFYVNGSSVGTYDATAFPTPPTLGAGLDAAVGHYSSSANAHDGYIDDVQWYAYPLSAAQALAQYNAGALPASAGGGEGWSQYAGSAYYGAAA